MAGLGAETTKVLEPKQSQILTMFTKQGQALHITLDGGATGSFIKHECAVKNKFKIWNNNQTAGLADNKTSVKSIGYVEETLFRDNWSVKFKGLVVENLKADVYGGVPFMIENDIIQRPAKNTITIHGKYTVLQTNPTIPITQPNSAALITLSNLNIQSDILLPGQNINIPLPPTITSEKVCIEPRLENIEDSWPTHNIYDNKDGCVTLHNTTNKTIHIGKEVNLINVTECNQINMDDIISTKHNSAEVKQSENQIHLINKNVDNIKETLSTTQYNKLYQIHKKYQDVFDGNLTGYNGFYGKHLVSINWADDTRPKSTRVNIPKWSSNRDKLLQEKIDQLTEMGVLADPYEHDVQVKCVHPCFLQKKARAGDKPMEDCNINEVRFLTAANSVNNLCRQIQTKIPDQNEIFKFVANNPFVIYADLYESFFQNHLHKRDWGYMAINSPFKGLRVYTRSTQGLLNQDEELNQLLSKVLGEVLMDGSCIKIADDLLVGGQTLDDAINNWEKVLLRLSNANLKLSPAKVRIFPKEASIFGWTVRQGTISPDPHRQLTLTKIKHTDIKTIGDLRSWMGVYKTFLIAMPGVAFLMDPFDKFVAGVKDSKAEVVWTEALVQAFKTAADRAKDSVRFLTLPKKHEQLVLMPDATVKNPAIGFILNVVRDDKLLPVIFYSFKLTDQQKVWFPCERECLALATAVKKCSHYILTSSKPTLVLTDSKPVVEAASLIRNGKFSNSARMSAFLCSVNRYKIDIQHVSGKFKHNIAADFLSRHPAQCKDGQCQVCKYIHEMSNVSLENINVENQIPFGTIESWKKLQENDYACSEAFKRLKSGQQPAKKGQNSNDIKRYFNACQAKNLLVAVDKIPNTTQTKHRIVVPKDVVPAVMTHLHTADDKHLSIYQLEKTFNRHFFGIHTKQIAQDTFNNCIICQANKTIPKNVFYQSSSDPQHPGCIFNVDVIRRHQQKILVCTDLFSSFTNAIIISDEKSDTLRDGIIQIITPIRAQNNVIIRTDSATGFKALTKCPMLEKLNIEIEPTDPSNKNSIATVDNAIKQLEKEIVKIAPHSTQINSAVLAAAIKNMNALIRNRGLSAHEILFSREHISNKNLHFKDKDLFVKQKENKQINNLQKASPKQIFEEFKIGDIIAIKSDFNKHNIRDTFLVTKIFEDKLQINKIIRFLSPNARIQTKPRFVRKCDVFIVNSRSMLIPTQTNTQTDKHTYKQNNIPKWSAFNHFSVETDDECEDKKHNDDPFNALKQWEIRQRQHALQSKSYQICSPKQSTTSLVQNVDLSNLPNRRESNSSDWDHGADINSPVYCDSDSDAEVFYDVDVNNLDQTLTDMNMVQNIDQLYDHHGLNVDTNICQNLENILPPPVNETNQTKKKKVSPLRKELPIERDLRTGVVTRSMSSEGDKVRFSCSSDRDTPKSRYSKQKNTKGEEGGMRNNPRF